MSHSVFRCLSCTFFLAFIPVGILNLTSCQKLGVTPYSSATGSFNIYHGRNAVALAHVSQSETGVAVVVFATRLAAGTHGVHIHETCRAGGHPIRGGRLPNIDADGLGIGKMETIIPGATLADVDSKYIVIHKGKDYGSVDPEMNAQGSVGCGRIRTEIPTRQIAVRPSITSSAQPRDDDR
jgi:Cu/Zn superoxide dismutase